MHTIFIYAHTHSQTNYNIVYIYECEYIYMWIIPRSLSVISVIVQFFFFSIKTVTCKGQGKWFKIHVFSMTQTVMHIHNSPNWPVELKIDNWNECDILNSCREWKIILKKKFD